MAHVDLFPAKTVNFLRPKTTNIFSLNRRDGVWGLLGFSHFSA